MGTIELFVCVMAFYWFGLWGGLAFVLAALALELWSMS